MACGEGAPPLVFGWIEPRGLLLVLVPQCYSVDQSWEFMSPKAWLVCPTLPSDLTNLSPHTPSSFLWAPWKTAGVHIPTHCLLNTQNHLSILLLLISVLGIKGCGNLFQAAIAGVVFNVRNPFPAFQRTNFTLSRSISGLSFFIIPCSGSQARLSRSLQK